MKIYVRYFIIGFLSLVSSCVNEKEDVGMQPDAVEVGDMLPEFTVVMNDGRTVESGSLQGHPSFILFFNTACGDCRRELPLVQQMYERYGADGRMVFMAISRGAGRGSCRRVLGGQRTYDTFFPHRPTVRFTICLLIRPYPAFMSWMRRGLSGRFLRTLLWRRRKT